MAAFIAVRVIFFAPNKRHRPATDRTGVRMKKFLTIATLISAVLFIGAACSSSEDAATTSKADAASSAPTSVAADSGSDNESDSGSGREADAASTGNPDVDALCAISKDMAEKIAANPDPAQLSAINQEYQDQLKELAGKLRSYNASNPLSAAEAEAMGTCMAEAMSITSGIEMPEMPGSGN
jgi:hypothetical protein